MSRQLSQKHHNIEENTLSSSWPIGCKKRSMEDYQKKQLDYLAEEMRKGKKVNPSLLLAETRIVKKYHGSEDFEYVNAEESNDKIVIEDEGCLGLQSASEERGKVDKKTLALAFQIEKDKSIVNSVNFSSLKLKNIYHVGNETFLKFVDELLSAVC